MSRRLKLPHVVSLTNKENVRGPLRKKGKGKENVSASHQHKCEPISFTLVMVNHDVGDLYLWKP